MYLILVGAMIPLRAQVTQIELFSGFDKTGFTFFSIQPLDPKGNFSIATNGNFDNHRKTADKIFNVAIVEGAVYWNLANGWAIGPTVGYNSTAGFKKKLSLLYAKGFGNFLVVVAPSFETVEKDYFGEAFTQIQYNKKFGKNWGLFAQLSAYLEFKEFSEHARSFQHLRLGPSYKHFQYWLSFNHDKYGPSLETTRTLGIFVRTSL